MRILKEFVRENYNLSENEIDTILDQISPVIQNRVVHLLKKNKINEAKKFLENRQYITESAFEDITKENVLYEVRRSFKRNYENILTPRIYQISEHEQKELLEDLNASELLQIHANLQGYSYPSVNDYAKSCQQLVNECVELLEQPNMQTNQVKQTIQTQSTQKNNQSTQSTQKQDPKDVSYTKDEEVAYTDTRDDKPHFGKVIRDTGNMVQVRDEKGRTRNIKKTNISKEPVQENLGVVGKKLIHFQKLDEQVGSIFVVRINRIDFTFYVAGDHIWVFKGDIRDEYKLTQMARDDKDVLHFASDRMLELMSPGDARTQFIYSLENAKNFLKSDFFMKVAKKVLNNAEPSGKKINPYTTRFEESNYGAMKKVFKTIRR